jgi:hypothetical protein
MFVGTAVDHQPRGARKAGVPEPGTVPEIWRWSQTAPVAELLESWKQKFRTLEWTVNPFDGEGGMMLRYDRVTDVSLLRSQFCLRYADNTVTMCRRFERSTVTMAGLTTSVAKNAVTRYENGTEISGNGCPNLGITCTRLLVSLLVLTMHGMIQPPRMTITTTTMMVMRATASYRRRPKGKLLLSSCSSILRARSPCAH